MLLFVYRRKFCNNAAQRPREAMQAIGSLKQNERREIEYVIGD